MCFSLHADFAHWQQTSFALEQQTSPVAVAGPVIAADSAGSGIASG
jgi:hypothetical protein